MNNHKNGCEPVQGVGCNVEACAYNRDGKDCRAEHIQVRNEQAQTKSETFCGTFMQKEARF